MKLKLDKKECNIYDTVGILCEKVNQLKKKNKQIKFQLSNKIFNNENEVDFIKNQISKIPEFISKKISMQLKFRLTENVYNFSNFYRFCKNIPNNLILIKTNKGERFGGFTQNPWDFQW